MGKIPVVFEDSEILVVIKRAGLACQGGAGIVHSVDRMLSEQTGQRIYLVHRLDRDTYGLLIAAKSLEAASKWGRIIRERLIRKDYIAICFGAPEDARQGELSGDVAVRGRSLPSRALYCVDMEGEVSAGESRAVMSSVSLQLITGRTHQLRIQLAQSGAPIAGDNRFGNFALNRAFASVLTKKLHLAAVSITLPSGRVISAPLPDYMQKARALIESAAWRMK